MLIVAVAVIVMLLCLNLLYLNLSFFFRTILVANNIQLLRKDSSPTFTGQDVSKIRKFSRQKNVVSSVAVYFSYVRSQVSMLFRIILLSIFWNTAICKA